MPTNRKRRSRHMIIHEEPLSESLEHYFIYGNLGGPPNLDGAYDTFRLLHPSRKEELKKVWLKYRGQILAKNKNPWAETNILDK